MVNDRFVSMLWHLLNTDLTGSRIDRKHARLKDSIYTWNKILASNSFHLYLKQIEIRFVIIIKEANSGKFSEMATDDNSWMLSWSVQNKRYRVMWKHKSEIKAHRHFTASSVIKITQYRRDVQKSVNSYLCCCNLHWSSCWWRGQR